MTTVRPAREDDLPLVYEVYYEDQAGEDSDPPPQPAVFPDIRHEFDSGLMLVAERAGRVCGFASLIVRERIAFLASLFVRRDEQSSGAGSLLLGRILPAEGYTLCTDSSSDPRALALYIRAGMIPQWPFLYLRAIAPDPAALSPSQVDVTQGQAGDPELLRWDAEICGRQRPVDHAYWVKQEAGIPLWFHRGGWRVGYGYVRLGAGSLRYPNAAMVGPVGARTEPEAVACTLAAVAWARRHTDVIRIDVPGPHPALRPLLDTGFRITDIDTFASSAPEPFVDPRLYIPADGSLF